MANPTVNLLAQITVQDTSTGDTALLQVAAETFRIVNDVTSFAKLDGSDKFTIAPSTVFPVDLTKLGGTAKLIYLEVDNPVTVLLSGSVTPQSVKKFILLYGDVTSISITTPVGPTVNVRLLMFA